MPEFERIAIAIQHFRPRTSDRGYRKGGDLDELASKYGCQDFSTKARSWKKALKKA